MGRCIEARPGDERRTPSAGPLPKNPPRDSPATAAAFAVPPSGVRWRSWPWGRPRQRRASSHRWVKILSRSATWRPTPRRISCPTAAPSTPPPSPPSGSRLGGAPSAAPSRAAVRPRAKRQPMGRKIPTRPRPIERRAGANTSFAYLRAALTRAWRLGLISVSRDVWMRVQLRQGRPGAPQPSDRGPGLPAGQHPRAGPARTGTVRAGAADRRPLWRILRH